MTIEKTRKNGNEGSGWVLSGAVDGDLSKWVEKWFATSEKAMAYATHKGWKVEAE